jgi:peroxisomal membrane protein 4
LLAGAFGGYFIWGKYTAVNNQILLYLTSRVIVAMWKRWCRIQGTTITTSHDLANGILSLPMISSSRRINLYPIVSTIIWGLVMMLYEETPELLHPTLKASMDEIYHVSLAQE